MITEHYTLHSERTLAVSRVPIADLERLAETHPYVFINRMGDHPEALLFVENAHCASKELPPGIADVASAAHKGGFDYIIIHA